MTPLFVALLVAQTQVDVPPLPAPLPVNGTFPAATWTGAEYALFWVDDQLDALYARPMVAHTRRHVWTGRVAPDGGVVAIQPTCEANVDGPLALSTNPALREVTVSWIEHGTDETYGVARTVVAQGATATPCILPFVTTTQPLDGLQSTWTGNETLVAWHNQGTSTIEAEWLKPNGASVGSGTVLVASVPSLDSTLTVGTYDAGIALGARFVFNDLAGVRRADLLALSTTTPSTVTLASAGPPLQLDQFGSVLVRGSGASQPLYAQFINGPSFPLSLPTTFYRPAVVTARLRGKSVAAAPIANGLGVQAFALDGGHGTATDPTAVGAYALATDQTDALLLTSSSNDGSLVVQSVALGSAQPVLRWDHFVALARPLQRRPSMAWNGSNWLLAFEEESNPGSTTRVVALPTSGGPVSATQQPGLVNVAVVGRPNGEVLWRSDENGFTVTHQPSDGGVVLTSPLAPAGAVTDQQVVHWSLTNLFTPGVPTGLPLVGVTPFRSSAATSDGVWLPVRTARGLETLFLSNALLASPVAVVPVPQWLHAPAFDDVAPAIAASGTGPATHVGLAWFSAPNVELKGFVAGDGGVLFRRTTFVGPRLGGLAAAPSRGGFVFAWTDVEGLQVRSVRADGGEGPSQTFGPPTAWPGDPVLSGSSTGPVAITWPTYRPGALSVGLSVVVVDPNLEPDADAGTSDAGTSDAGAVDAGAVDSGSPDAGAMDAGASSDGGPSPDAGQADGGGGADGGPMEFDTSGCACSGSPGALGLGLLLLLAARRARRPQQKR